MHTKTISIDLLRHSNRICYIHSGHGGKPIHDWPYYNFISQYLGGEEKKSINRWTEWIVLEFQKYCRQPKSRGGMLNGSVHRSAISYSPLDKNIAAERPDLISQEVVYLAALEYVNDRLKVVSSIAEQGFKPQLSKQLTVIRKGKFYILSNGHHRAASLYALGHREFPNLNICSKLEWMVLQYHNKLNRKFSNAIF